MESAACICASGRGSSGAEPPLHGRSAAWVCRCGHRNGMAVVWALFVVQVEPMSDQDTPSAATTVQGIVKLSGPQILFLSTSNPTVTKLVGRV